jgi:hypothetical protein
MIGKNMKTRIITILAGLVASLALSLPSQAAVAEPLTPPPAVERFSYVDPPQVPSLQPVAGFAWHIRNSSTSVNEAFIYQNTTCSGNSYPTEFILYAGDEAKSTAWQSFGIWSDRHKFTVHVYHGTTGERLAIRNYEWWECVKAYTTNDYLIYVKWI